MQCRSPWSGSRFPPQSSWGARAPCSWGFHQALRCWSLPPSDVRWARNQRKKNTCCLATSCGSDSDDFHSKIMSESQSTVPPRCKPLTASCSPGTVLLCGRGGRMFCWTLSHLSPTGRLSRSLDATLLDMCAYCPFLQTATDSLTWGSTQLSSHGDSRSGAWTWSSWMLCCTVPRGLGRGLIWRLS